MVKTHRHADDALYVDTATSEPRRTEKRRFPRTLAVAGLIAVALAAFGITALSPEPEPTFLPPDIPVGVDIPGNPDPSTEEYCQYVVDQDLLAMELFDTCVAMFADGAPIRSR